MERKGSGFGKIISGYEFQINYDESNEVNFRATKDGKMKNTKCG